MKAAICDESHILLEELKRNIKEHNLIAAVDSFDSPSELILQIKDGKKYDVIFMDLDWKEEQKNGLQWGEEIFKMAPEIMMIFTTGHNDRFAQHVLLSKVNLAGYITKPIDNEILKQYIEKVSLAVEQPQHIVLSRYGNKMSVNMDEIIYVESKNHKVIVHTMNQEYEIYEKLSDVQGRLSKDFVHCHKSFVANMKWVEGYEGKSFKLKNGDSLSISRTYASEAKEAFLKYVGNMM